MKCKTSMRNESQSNIGSQIVLVTRKVIVVCQTGNI